MSLSRDRPTLISLNRFEMKKNAVLAIEAFALLRTKPSMQQLSRNMRLVLAGTVPCVRLARAPADLLQVAMTPD